MTTDAEYLRDRYGSRSSDRTLAWVAGIVLGAIAVAWLIWQALALGEPSITAQGVALTVDSDAQVTVTFNLAAEVGSTVTCTVRASTDAAVEVGVREVTVGPLESDTVAVTTTVATIQPATTAEVTDCRFVDD